MLTASAFVLRLATARICGPCWVVGAALAPVCCATRLPSELEECLC